MINCESERVTASLFLNRLSPIKIYDTYLMLFLCLQLNLNLSTGK